MKHLILLIILVPLNIFSQDIDVITQNCWKEYKHDNLPLSDDPYCPLILCPDNSWVCYIAEGEEVYTSEEAWKRNAENQIEFGDVDAVNGAGWIFDIILETDSELQLRSVEHPTFIIYLKR